MRCRWLICLSVLGIFILGLVLRSSGLAERPIHADEATGARILAERLEGNGYEFNPTHFHGPSLSAISVAFTKVAGENDWHSLTVETLRLAPLIAGLLMLLTPLLWMKRIGALPAIVACACMATSPLLVYYNRMYIHESWLALFGMLACYLIYSVIEKPRLVYGIFAGLFLGLMFATKATFAFSVISWFLGTVAMLFYGRIREGNKTPETQSMKEYFQTGSVCIFVAALISTMLYTDAFRNMAGIVDAVRSYFIYETVGGHEKPIGYYVELMLVPKQALGLWWTEAAIALFAVFACIHAMRTQEQMRPVIFLSVATLSHILIYSMIGYKTPWLMLLPWAHACLLAGFTFTGFKGWGNELRIASVLVLLAGLTYQTRQTMLACGRLSNDVRNPYAYVPTSKDAGRLEEWLLSLKAMNTATDLQPIAVVGREYWPLPWYLRDFETIGYWDVPDMSFMDYPLVIAMPPQVEACDTILEQTHVRLPRTLRADVPVILYLQNELWEQWTSSETP